MDVVTLALHLAAEIMGHIPEPDPELRRAHYVQRLARLVGRLEARAALRPLTPAQVGRLAGAKAALATLSPAVTTVTAGGSSGGHSASQAAPESGE